jgi:hypothetical protein
MNPEDAHRRPSRLCDGRSLPHGHAGENEIASAPKGEGYSNAEVHFSAPHAATIEVCSAMWTSSATKNECNPSQS